MWKMETNLEYHPLYKFYLVKMQPGGGMGVQKSVNLVFEPTLLWTNKRLFIKQLL